MPQYLGGNDVVSKKNRYAGLWASLKAERSTVDAHWKEIADFYLPQRSRFNASSRNRDSRRNEKIIDSTGRFASRTLASGLHAGLTSPARPWMKLTTHDPQLAQMPDVKAWLAKVTTIMLAIFEASNIYNTLPLVYQDMGLFATGAMAILPDDEDVIRCASFPIGSYAIQQDRRGKTSTFVREYEWTVGQVVEEFGVQANGRDIDWSNLSTPVKTAWDRGSYTDPVTVLWVVEPNREYDAARGFSRFKKFSSCYLEQGNDEHKFLRESGFDTFPVMAPRWDITGEDAYGTDCPGMTALGDVKQLQSQHRRKGQLIAKAVDPPLQGPSALRSQKTSLLPGDVTYVDVREGQQSLKPIHEVRLDGLQFLLQDMREVQSRVNIAFFVDLFRMLSSMDSNPDGGTQPITAREVEERHEEKLLALGPVLERTNDELLNPAVSRTFAILQAARMLPRPPKQLEGVNLKVQYTSVLADAQKLVGVVGLDRYLQSTGAMAQVWPEVRHKVDPMACADRYADMLGVDPSVNRTTEAAQQMAAQEQQQQQAAASAQSAGTLAKAAKDASQAPVTGDSVLARVVAANAAGVPAAPVGQPPATPPGQ